MTLATTGRLLDEHDDVRKSQGRRERNKRDKLDRIKAAARALFAEKGFDAATTRQIAQRAGVGLGTLFSYAQDKRDLLFLCFNEELNELAEKAFSNVNAGEELPDQLAGAFRHFYAFFSEDPQLARFLLRELTFYVAGTQADRFQQSRRGIVDGLENMVHARRERGEIASAEDSRAIAQLLFAIYQAEVRRWLLDDEVSVEKGLARLRRMFALAVQGLIIVPGKVRPR